MQVALGKKMAPGLKRLLHCLYRGYALEGHRAGRALEHKRRQLLNRRFHSAKDVVPRKIGISERRLSVDLARVQKRRGCVEEHERVVAAHLRAGRLYIACLHRTLMFNAKLPQSGVKPSLQISGGLSVQKRFKGKRGVEGVLLVRQLPAQAGGVESLHVFRSGGQSASAGLYPGRGVHAFIAEVVQV